VVLFNKLQTKIYIISFCLFGSQKLDKIPIYREKYEYKFKNVLYKISSYEELIAEKSFESD